MRVAGAPISVARTAVAAGRAQRWGCARSGCRLTRCQDPPGRRGVALEAIGWTDRPFDQITAAVRANMLKYLLRAGGAKRAFIRANMRPGILWRQIAVAVLAVRPQFQHDSSPQRR